MTRKIINANDVGTSTIFGSDDTDYINRLLTGEDQSATDPVNIGTSIQFTNQFRLNKTFTMAELQNDVNNYSFSSTANNLRLTSDAARNITGFAGGVSGKVVQVHNVGLFNITFKDDSTLSTITNRFEFNNGDLVLSPKQSVTFWYDSVSGKWRVLSSPKGLVGEINTASNLGSGQGVFKTKSGVDLQFRSLTATSTKIILANNTNDIGIDVNEANFTTVLKNTVDNDLGTHYLEFGEITSPANPSTNKHRLYIDSSDDHLKRKDSAGTVKDYDAGGGGSGDVTGAANVGSGTGLIFRDEVSGVLNLKSLLQGSGITLTNNTNDITIAASGGGSGITVYNRAVTDNDIVNTSTKTTLYSFTVNANDLGTDKILEIDIFCDYLNDSGSSRSFDFWIEFGSTTLFQHTFGSYAAAATRRPLFLKIFLANRNSSSSQQCWGFVQMGDTDAPTVGIGHLGDDEIGTSSPFGGTATEATNVNKTLTISIQHTTASASLSLRRKTAVAKLL